MCIIPVTLTVTLSHSYYYSLFSILYSLFSISHSIYELSMSRSNIGIPSSEICSSTWSIFHVAPCKFQVQVCDHQLQGKDVILVAPTGVGKSLTFMMPFIWLRDSVSILICPIQLLGAQHASHPGLQALGIRAINLTSETASDQVFKVRGLQYSIYTAFS
jgi:superfamily II DNA or RNA helicase